MVSIVKGQNSYIYIVLTDKRSTSSNVYVVNFENLVTKENVSCTLTDISSYPLRYSKFLVPLINFQSSTVGFWKYEVTQSGSGAYIVATGKMELLANNLSTTGVVRYSDYVGTYKTYTV